MLETFEEVINMASNHRTSITLIPQEQSKKRQLPKHSSTMPQAGTVPTKDSSTKLSTAPPKAKAPIQVPVPAEVVATEEIVKPVSIAKGDPEKVSG